MTRNEHIRWCKQRALQELNFYQDEKEAIRNCLTSMASDLRKHPETNSEALTSFTILSIPSMRTKADAKKFIEGFAE